MSGRYNPGYRHWVEGCLMHGGSLHIGTLDDEALNLIDDLENYFIQKYPPTMEQRSREVRLQAEIHHEGEVPLFIKSN